MRKYVKWIGMFSVAILSACQTNNTAPNQPTKFTGFEQFSSFQQTENWGFILVSSQSKESVYKTDGILGYGGFPDQASCEVEASERLNELAEKYQDYIITCFSPFPKQQFEPYKIL